jgi:hypothetical protein
MFHLDATVDDVNLLTISIAPIPEEVTDNGRSTCDLLTIYTSTSYYVSFGHN